MTGKKISLKNVLILLPAVFSASIVCSYASSAMKNQVVFKKGDRVEVDIMMMSDPKNSTYKKATIDEVDEPNRSYLVTVDALPGKIPQQYRIGIRDYGKHWVRLIPGRDTAPKTVTEKLRTDGNGTVLADRALLDCTSFTHAGKNGAPPPVELAKKLVRCLYEKPSLPGEDGARTMDITSFAIGAPHRWRVYVDIGQGTANTLVYPLHVTWNQKTFYRGRNVLQTGNEGTFTCFVDSTHLWQCGHASGPSKEGHVQEIVVK